MDETLKENIDYNFKYIINHINNIQDAIIKDYNDIKERILKLEDKL